jgi:hypothetical protein
VVRDPVDANDMGTLLNGPSYNGKLYHWHLFIRDIAHMRFGYDCFVSSVSRDRNVIERDALLKMIASIASRSIMQEDNVGTKLFLMEICLPLKGRDTLEARALPLLTQDAKRKLLLTLEQLIPGKRFVSYQQEAQLSPQFVLKKFVALPEHAIVLFESVSCSLRDFKENFVQEFLAAPRVNASEKLQIVFKSICTVAFCQTQLDTCVNYAVQETESLPIVVFHCKESGFTKVGLDTLLFLIVPNLVSKHKLKIPNAVQFVSRLTLYFENEQRSRSKRQKTDALLPPPPGYAYYDGPPLLVKIEK